MEARLEADNQRANVDAILPEAIHDEMIGNGAGIGALHRRIGDQRAGCLGHDQMARRKLGEALVELESQQP